MSYNTDQAADGNYMAICFEDVISEQTRSLSQLTFKVNKGTCDLQDQKLKIYTRV
jgi:hypothetical protein